MIDISEYENEPNLRFMDIYPDALDNDLSKVNNFLYHAILKYNDYEILENIFKERNIYALKYVMKFAKQYSFNANEGKYVSLLSLDKNQENYDHLYNAYIKKNISLIISPFLNPIKTKHIEFDDWCYIIKKYSYLKNRYSFLMGEYQVKDSISFDFVNAIGIPYLYFEDIHGSKYAVDCIEKVSDLMNNYNINIPVVDTSNSNKLLKKINKNDIEKQFSISFRLLTKSIV